MLNEEQHKQAAENEYNFDHPDAFDYDLLIQTLKNLKEGKCVEVIHLRNVGLAQAAPLSHIGTWISKAYLLKGFDFVKLFMLVLQNAVLF